MSKTSEAQSRNRLETIPSRLPGGDVVEPLIGGADEDPSDVEDFVEVIQSLHSCLRPVSPDQAYAEGLRAELLDAGPDVFKRVQQLPARLSVAAILAVFAGCVLLMLRRIFGSAPAADMQEEAVATPL